MARWLITFGLAVSTCVLAFFLFDSKETAIIVSITGVCLSLWLSELTPPFVPTLLLWVLIPTFLYPINKTYSISQVLSWAADPVLALFFGGFVLGHAITSHHLDRSLTRILLRNVGSQTMLLFTVIFITAIVSMWISNIAAAAMMFASLRPLLNAGHIDDVARRVLLVGIAFGGSLGGMATPIGTGPNAIAIAALSDTYHVTFGDWMIFAVPLTIAVLLGTYFLLSLRLQAPNGSPQSPILPKILTARPDATTASPKSVLLILLACITLWLTEPIHGISSSLIALASAAFLFGSKLLSASDIARIDWSTLLLISGGITLGRLLEASAVVSKALGATTFIHLHPTLTLFVFCFVAASFSALMSNTATAVMLIPLAMSTLPLPSTGILVAIACSFGVPFVISTPPNAMAYGEGGLKASDLFYPGIVIMIVGCILISLTGKPVLNFIGIP